MRQLLFPLLLFTFVANAQTYTSYRTGAPESVTTAPRGGSCLMGGATEDDNAMRWFLQRADGGDVVVLRASGSDGYNAYFYSELGATLNSVETLVLHEAAATQEAYVRQRIAEAEAIWLAGGNQATYVSEWRGAQGLDSLVNAAVNERNAVIGGTSAGMAILGRGYFSAANGTITSAEALTDPFDAAVTVDTTAFLHLPYLDRVLTDTHFDNPDRRGRHAAFLARLYAADAPFRGIACDEYTAVCIDENGQARVFGGFPTYDDYAYFVRPNCAIAEGEPEILTPGSALTWDRNGTALSVHRLEGTAGGTQTFDLTDWSTDDGTHLFWSVNDGMFNEQEATAAACLPPTSTREIMAADWQIFPQPVSLSFALRSERDKKESPLQLYDWRGRIVRTWPAAQPSYSVADLPAGTYFLRRRNSGKTLFIQR